MQNRFIIIISCFIACCFSDIAIANNSYQQETISSEARSANIVPSVVREQVSHSKYERITFSDDSCDIICGVNNGIKHFELSEYLKSQSQKLNQMSLEILKEFSVEELEFFNSRKTSPIMCELTVLKDGKIANTTLIIPARCSTDITDQKLQDIKEIITHTQLDEIPHSTSAVRFYWGVPRELCVQFLESKN